MLIFTMGLLGLVALAAGGALLVDFGLRRLKASHGRRAKLWERLYGLAWGEVTTNNYGYAPADGRSPERFQLQMYMEHLKALKGSGWMRPHTDLLEVSCGRGGGLAHLVEQWPGSLDAVGLDLSRNALAACEATHGHLSNLRFVRGSALALPFPDASFDVVLNVEASNDYGDYAGFFREVHRVLRPGGVFLYCDSRKPEAAAAVAFMLGEAGLAGAFRDITDHVLRACDEDSDRRLRMLRARVRGLHWWLFGRALRSYAAVKGSRKYEAFRTRQRLYMMTCAVKLGVESRADRVTATRPATAAAV